MLIEVCLLPDARPPYFPGGGVRHHGHHHRGGCEHDGNDSGWEIKVNADEFECNDALRRSACQTPPLLLWKGSFGFVTMIRKINILISALTLLAPCTASAALAADATPTAELNSFMLTVINSDRVREHSAPVVEDPALTRLAQAYAEYLLRTKTFAHVDGYGRNPQQRAEVFGIQTPVAENLAYEMDSQEQPQTLLKKAQADMMNEPRRQQNHRMNITNPAHHFVGIGIARTDDMVILVQEFAEEKPMQLR